MFVIQRNERVKDSGNRSDSGRESPVAVASGTDRRLFDDEIVGEFVSRQTELLAHLEARALDIETERGGADLPDLMRFFHTLKGESALLGLDDVSRLAHATEDMLDREPLVVCVDRILAVKDWLALRFAAMSGESGGPGSVADLIAELERGPHGIYGLNLLELDVDMLQDFIAETGEHLDAVEGRLLALENEPDDEEAVNAVFRCFHTIKGVAGFVEMEHIKELAHMAENLLDRVRRGELPLRGETMDLAFAAVDLHKRLCEDVAAGMAGDGRLIRRDELAALVARLGAACGEDPPGETIVSADGIPEAVETDASGLVILPRARRTQAPAETPVPDVAPGKPAPQRTGSVHRREAVRVDAERLDLLVETVGELVIAEAMVSQNREVRELESLELERHLDRLDKICRELQQIGMSLRMVPVRPVFQKMARLVRDLAKRSGRRVEFSYSGEETELDKSVVDMLGDPLVHMLRNSVDHGIESDPAAREAAGKPRVGNIELRALHRGGGIVIEVEDDGRGLDRDAILARAVQRGLVVEGAQLSDQEIYSLIFEPGFTTTSEVTDVSGRGVGMDVVRRNIEKLRGTVDIASESGRGCVFSFKLPLTLAIIEGMVFLTGGERYIVPTLSVVRLIRPEAEAYTTVMSRGEMLRFEGEIIPLIRLYEIFGVENAKEALDDAVVIVVESEGRRVGLLTDELVGQQQIVIKNLGEHVQDTEGLAGGAIMSDGNVALILDIAGLVRVAHEEKGAVNTESGGRS